MRRKFYLAKTKQLGLTKSFKKYKLKNKQPLFLTNYTIKVLEYCFIIRLKSKNNHNNYHKIKNKSLGSKKY
jgi:hypothetical protein